MRRKGVEKIVVGKTKRQRFLKHNSTKPRKFGQSLAICTRCGSTRRFIGKYGLNVCGRCFREIALTIGFKKNR